MPPKSASRRKTSTPEQASGARTPRRTGLRSQTPITQPTSVDTGNQAAQRELPQLQSRATHAYGSPGNTDIAQELQTATGAANVTQVFGAALNNSLEDTNDTAQDQFTQPQFTQPSKRKSATPSSLGESTEAYDGLSWTNSASALANTKPPKKSGLFPMPSIRESTNSPDMTAHSPVGYDTTRLDNSAFGGFVTPSRPASLADDVDEYDPVISSFAAASRRQAAAAPSSGARDQANAQTSNLHPFHSANQTLRPSFDYSQLLPGKKFLYTLFALGFAFAVLLLGKPQLFSTLPFMGGVTAHAEAVKYTVSSWVSTFGQCSKVSYPWALHSRLEALEITMADLAKADHVKALETTMADLAKADRVKALETNMADAAKLDRVKALEADMVDVVKHYRVKQIETNIAEMTKTVYDHEMALESLMAFLPERIIMKKDDNGQYHITEDFWRAIRAEVENSTDTSWADFLQKNQRKLDEYGDARASLVENRHFQNWKKENAVVSKEEFMVALKENLASLQDKVVDNFDAYEKRLHALEQGFTDEQMTMLERRIAASSVKSSQEALKGLSGSQLGNVATVILTQNTEMHLRNINFLSPSFGAMIDPYRSSPTANSRTANLPHRSFFQTFKGVVPNRHIMSLEPWTEPRDCWCAAPPADPRVNGMTTTVHDPDDPDASTIMRGEEGALTPRLQLAAVMPQPVYPKQVTIEYFPTAGVVDASSMPRDMEVWVSVLDERAREQLAFDADFVFRESSEERRNQMRGKDLALDKTYVKIGMFRYNHDAPNHVQTFDLNVAPHKRGIGIRRLIVRATSNYGGDATCLYRVRLHGSVAPVEGVSM